MMPITPRGKQTLCILMPFGRDHSARRTPMGSRAAAISARPRAMASTRKSSRRSRSSSAADNPVPDSRISASLAVRTSAREWSSADAAASNARFFCSFEANASFLAASLAALPMPCIKSAMLFTGFDTIRGIRCGSQDSEQHQIVTMHDFIATAKSQHLLDIGRLAADDARRVHVRIGADASADLGAIRADDADGIAAVESPERAGDAGGEETLAAHQCTNRAIVDRDRTRGLQSARDPLLAGGNRRR